MALRVKSSASRDACTSSAEFGRASRCSRTTPTAIARTRISDIKGLELKLHIRVVFDHSDNRWDARSPKTLIKLENRTRPQLIQEFRIQIFAQRLEHCWQEVPA